MSQLPPPAPSIPPTRCAHWRIAPRLRRMAGPAFVPLFLLNLALEPHSMGMPLPRGRGNFEIVRRPVCSKANTPYQAIPDAPGPFGKIRPQDGADDQKTRLTLMWEESLGAVSYEYCIDKNLDSDCTSPAEWVNVGTLTSVTVSKLKMGTPYEWQVRAFSSSGGTTYADDGDWWVFTTKEKPSPSKITPLNGASNQPTNMLLEWDEDETAISYEYCLDTTDDGACSTAWVSTGLDTSVYLRGLDPNTTYYWHVRSVTASGYNYADELETDFWAFTTGETSVVFEFMLPLIVK